MPAKSVTTVAYREELLKSLKNPREAAAYLNACLEDSDPGVFLMALRMLSTAGNPPPESLNAVLKAMGLRISIERITANRRTRRVA